MRIFVILTVLVLLVLALRSRRFLHRLCLTALAVILAVVGYSFFTENRHRHTIAPDELVFSNVVFAPYLAGFRFTAAITNTNQRYSVQQLGMRFIPTLCTDTSPVSCYQPQAVVRTIYLVIDPLATAATVQSISLPQVDLSGQQVTSWEYAVDEVRAIMPESPQGTDTSSR